MIALEMILIIFMSLVMSVSFGELSDSFCSEKNFTAVKQNQQGGISVQKSLNESWVKNWVFNNYPDGKLKSSVMFESYPLAQIMRNRSLELDFKESKHPCIQKLRLYGSTDWNVWQIFFNDCPKYNRKEGETKNISIPDVQYLGRFWLESKPEEIYFVGQNINGKDLTQKQLVYRLSDDMNSMHSTNKTITEFFGCPPLQIPTLKPNDTEILTSTVSESIEMQSNESNLWKWFAIFALFGVFIIVVIIIGLLVWCKTLRRDQMTDEQQNKCPKTQCNATYCKELTDL